MKTHSNQTLQAIASCAVDTPWAEIGEDALRGFLELSPTERGKAWAACVRNAKSESVSATEVRAIPIVPLPAVISLQASELPTQAITPVSTPIEATKPSPGGVEGYPESIIQVTRVERINYPPWKQKVMLPDLERRGPIMFNMGGLVPSFHPDQKHGPVKAQVVYEWLKATIGTDGSPLINGCLGLIELEEIKRRNINFFRTYFTGIEVLGWRSVISDKAERTAEEFVTREGREGLPDFSVIKKKLPFVSGLFAREQTSVESDDAINLRVPYLVEIRNEVKLVWLSLDKPVGVRQPALLFK